mmetsp:Transcript_42568/g.76498  ORF Transcript_42568/g.76498 Transcript_42568/m.76498 type:complete len:218 (-) Transcript_42568:1059-1712(-)
MLRWLVMPQLVDVIREARLVLHRSTQTRHVAARKGLHLLVALQPRGDKVAPNRQLRIRPVRTDAGIAVVAGHTVETAEVQRIVALALGQCRSCIALLLQDLIWTEWGRIRQWVCRISAWQVTLGAHTTEEPSAVGPTVEVGSALVWHCRICGRALRAGLDHCLIHEEVLLFHSFTQQGYRYRFCAALVAHDIAFPLPEVQAQLLLLLSQGHAPLILA